MISNNYVGVDISKASFDVAIHQDSAYQYAKFSNDEKGFKAFFRLLNGECQVVMEASGPYYTRLAFYLHQQGITVSVINPLVIRRFCQMRLSRTKTDRKDAMMIAEYGRSEHPSPWKPDQSYVLELKQMQAATDLLNKSRTSYIRQADAFRSNQILSKEALTSILKAQKEAEKQMEILQQRMEQIVQKHHGIIYKRLQSIPGLGKKTSMLLIVVSGGFSKFENSKQMSSYIGLCPRIFESGTSVKGRSRITKMGMSRMRSMLYLCSWSAKRCNKTCRELYERLVAKGKAKMVALIAVTNKLIKQAFAIVKSESLYQENYRKNICF